MPRTALLATVLACCAAPALAQQEGLERRATFIDTEGAEIGAVRMISTPNGVLFALDLQGLPPDSWHGFHVHETGECDPQTGFESAGGHYNIADTPHGYHSVTARNTTTVFISSLRETSIGVTIWPSIEVSIR